MYPSNEFRIPLFLAATVSSALLAFGFAAMWAEPRPSSTAGLGCVFVPLWALAVGGVTFVLGLVIRSLWKRPIKISLLAMSIPYTVIVVAAGAAGVQVASRAELAAKPRVLIGEGRILAVKAPLDAAPRSAARVPVEPDVKRISSKGNELTVFNGQDGLAIELSGVQGPVFLDTLGLDYVTEVQAVRVGTRDGGSAFVLAVTGRATGGRARLLVVSATGNVVYDELVECEWRIDGAALEVRKAAGGSDDVVVVAPGRVGERAFVVLARNSRGQSEK
jgi:hypothetical protein